MFNKLKICGSSDTKRLLKLKIKDALTLPKKVSPPFPCAEKNSNSYHPLFVLTGG